MNLSENFQEVIESMKRPVAVLAVALTPMFMTGCANMKLNLPEGNMGGIPVGRVINQSVNRDVYDAKKAAAGQVKGALRGTACLDENGHVTHVVVGEPRQCDVQKNNRTGVSPRPR